MNLCRIAGRSSGPGNRTSGTLWATSSNPSTYRWTYLRSSFVVRLWPLAKCAAACFGTTAVRHSMQTMIRCWRERRKYLAKTSAWADTGTSMALSGCVDCRVSRSGNGGWVVVGYPVSDLTAAIHYMPHALCYLCRCPDLRPVQSQPLRTLKLSVPLYLRPSACGTPDVWVRWGWCGVWPRVWNIKTDLTPPAAATVSRDGVGSGR
jgi:hypothetical protein